MIVTVYSTQAREGPGTGDFSSALAYNHIQGRQLHSSRSSRLLNLPSFIRGKGVSGTGTSRNLHKTSHPCEGWKTSRRSGGILSWCMKCRALHQSHVLDADLRQDTTWQACRVKRTHSFCSCSSLSCIKPS